MALDRSAGSAVVFALALIGCGGVARQGATESGGAGGNGSAASGGAVALGGQPAGGDAGRSGSGGGGASVGGISGGGGTSGSDANGGAVTVDAGAGGTAGQTGNVPLASSSWDVQLAMTVTKTQINYGALCAQTSFTLHVDPQEEQLELISGRDGSVLTGELERVTTGTPAPSYRASATLTLPTPGCEYSTVSVKELTLAGWDDDSDGIADRVEGQGRAQGSFFVGDQGFQVELSFTLSGLPDSHAPSLALARPSPIHPLDGVLLRASEPVSIASTVSLSDVADAGKRVALLGATASNGALGSFSTSAVLAFGSTWSPTVTGTDLAGLPFTTALAPIQVLADPGLFAQDGFEATPQALLSAGAVVVSHVGTIAALSGDHSLFVPAGSSATLHLAATSAVSKVRFSAQSFSQASGYAAGSPPLELAAVGGTRRLTVPSSTTGATPTDTGDATWRYAGARADYDLALPEPGTEFVVRIAEPYCMGFCPPQQAVLIDDLVLE